VEPEGSENLGGIVTDARPAQNDYILSRANGSYVMEFKIPLWGLFYADSRTADINPDAFVDIVGQKVKMDFTIFDDDVESPDLSKVVRSSLSRHPAWWGINQLETYPVLLGPYESYDWRGSSVFAPVFQFMGDHYSSQPLVAKILPNEYEIYGGKLPGYLNWLTPVSPTTLNNPRTYSATHLSLNIVPNPMVSSSYFQFSLPWKDRVGLQVYNPAGALIMDLGTQTLPAGFHGLHWDGNQKDGQKAAKGNYLLRLKTSKKVLTKKLTIIR